MDFIVNIFWFIIACSGLFFVVGFSYFVIRDIVDPSFNRATVNSPLPRYYPYNCLRQKEPEYIVTLGEATKFATLCNTISIPEETKIEKYN